MKRRVFIRKMDKVLDRFMNRESRFTCILLKTQLNDKARKCYENIFCPTINEAFEFNTNRYAFFDSNIEDEFICKSNRILALGLFKAIVLEEKLYEQF